MKNPFESFDNPVSRLAESVDSLARARNATLGLSALEAFTQLHAAEHLTQDLLGSSYALAQMQEDMRRRDIRALLPRDIGRELGELAASSTTDVYRRMFGTPSFSDQSWGSYWDGMRGARDAVALTTQLRSSLDIWSDRFGAPVLDSIAAQIVESGLEHPPDSGVANDDLAAVVFAAVASAFATERRRPDIKWIVTIGLAILIFLYQQTHPATSMLPPNHALQPAITLPPGATLLLEYIAGERVVCDTPLRSAPRPSSGRIGSVRHGDRVLVRDQRRRWRRVIALTIQSDHAAIQAREGWMLGKCIERVR